MLFAPLQTSGHCREPGAFAHFSPADVGLRVRSRRCAIEKTIMTSTLIFTLAGAAFDLGLVVGGLALPFAILGFLG